ncbi:hypothetical protein [Vibrio ezurae]|uniref:hypothetical protein n=1 Tax=Vibrio ezurae TaxID=252583 RepID=UPI000593F6D1|nr:hypothetical protein [Vibrio ezurae]
MKKECRKNLQFSEFFLFTEEIDSNIKTKRSHSQKALLASKSLTNELNAQNKWLYLDNKKAIGLPIARKIPFVINAFRANILLFIVLMIFKIRRKYPFAGLILSHSYPGSHMRKKTIHC